MKNTAKRIIAICIVLAALVSVFALPTSAATRYYSDISTTDVDYTLTKWLNDNNIMSGKPNNVFDKYGTLTRAELVTTLWRVVGHPESYFHTNYDVFSDVRVGSWYYEPVKWAVSMGIATGYTDGTFKPNDKVTNEDAMVFMKRFLTIYLDGSYANSLRDDNYLRSIFTAFSGSDLTYKSSYKYYAQPAAGWARSYGFIDSNLKGSNYASRIWWARFLYKVIRCDLYRDDIAEESYWQYGLAQGFSYR